jgi:hypothetical protein
LVRTNERHDDGGGGEGYKAGEPPPRAGGGGARVDGGRLPKTLFELGSSHLQPYPRKSLHVVLVWVANAVLDVEVETDEGESF